MTAALATPEAVWRRNGGTIRGPEPATLANLRSLSFLHWLARLDLLGGRIPPHSPETWAYSIERDRIELWRDLAGRLVGFAVSRLAGREAALVTVPLDPCWGQLGIQGRIVEAAITGLRERGADTITFEALPSYPEHLSTALRLGFRPNLGGLTTTFTRLSSRDAPAPPEDAPPDPLPPSPWRLGPSCLELVERVAPGLDLSADLQITEAQSIGGLTVVEERGAVAGFALWHRRYELGLNDVRVRAVVAAGPIALERLLQALQGVTSAMVGGLLSLRAQDAPPWAFDRLLAAKFIAIRADARLVLGGSKPARRSREGIAWVRWRL